MTDNFENMAPWEDEQGMHWLSSLSSWPKIVRLILTTLKQDPRKYPHQIRAAVSLVIMLGRKNVWPNRVDIVSLDDAVALARRQLAQVKHHFSVSARVNPDLKRHPGYRALLDSIDQELKILESRMAEEDLKMPNEAPSSWTNFWAAEE